MAAHEYVSIDVTRARPALEYPGAPASGTGLLDGDRFWIGRDAGRLDGRSLVLAIGSNAAPAVLAGKLHRAGVTDPVPFVRAEVHGVAVGHSAHVSRGGYVPAAPYAADVVTETWAQWLTDEQRAAVDATEPNYTRVELAAADYPIRLEDGRRVATYGIYASRWGVLAAGGVPLRLGTQAELHARLAVDGPSELVPWGDAESAMRALADADVRERVRDWFAAAGWALDAGLTSSG
jgi:hypothetical protein